MYIMLMIHITLVMIFLVIFVEIIFMNIIELTKYIYCLTEFLKVLGKYNVAFPRIALMTEFIFECLAQ